MCEACVQVSVQLPPLEEVHKSTLVMCDGAETIS